MDLSKRKEKTILRLSFSLSSIRQYKSKIEYDAIWKKKPFDLMTNDATFCLSVRLFVWPSFSLVFQADSQVTSQHSYPKRRHRFLNWASLPDHHQRQHHYRRRWRIWRVRRLLAAATTLWSEDHLLAKWCSSNSSIRSTTRLATASAALKHWTRVSNCNNSDSFSYATVATVKDWFRVQGIMSCQAMKTIFSFFINSNSSSNK